MRIGNGPGQFVDEGIHARTSAALIRVHEFAREQGDFFGLELQVFDQIVVNGFNFVWPFLSFVFDSP